MQVLSAFFPAMMPATNRGYDPVDFVADIAPVPLLLIHSQDDRIIPYAFNAQLLQAALAPKTLYETSGPHTATLNNAAYLRKR